MRNSKGMTKKQRKNRLFNVQCKRKVSGFDLKWKQDSSRKQFVWTEAYLDINQLVEESGIELGETLDTNMAGFGSYKKW